MKVGTIRKTRVFDMRYGGCLSRTRDPRERNLPDGSQSCGSAQDAGATREYQRDSSSKRPAFSVVSAAINGSIHLKAAATRLGGRLRGKLVP
jgi:hypothetical protein